MSVRNRMAENDMEKIMQRARVIHFRTESTFPYDHLAHGVRESYEESAASELWDENALNFEPAVTRHRFIE